MSERPRLDIELFPELAKQIVDFAFGEDGKPMQPDAAERVRAEIKRHYGDKDKEILFKVMP